MAQKLPTLEMMKPIEDIMNNIHPIRFIVLFFIFFLPGTQVKYEERSMKPIQQILF